jgi:predicted ATPase/DNA-binding CsgD family transcriptional regulator
VPSALAAKRGLSRPGNLPLELTSFVGRSRELLEIRRLLAVAHTVTLTGPGGIGKSRLALRAAHDLGRHFPDGCWWVELAELDSPDLVVPALVRSLGVYERPDVAIDDALLDHVRERRLLLVLDNCEGLLDACREVVSAIVSRSEAVRILCTSRQRLASPGETLVALSPLEVPADAEQPSVATLADVESLRLLVERARATAPDFALTDENCEAACDICRRLDGLPLAIELAAVRLASISAGDLLERLDDRFRLLTAERGQQSQRHQALRATVEWSHELLGEEERILWRRLSVFAGSFGIEAAEAVCAGEGLDRDEILGLIGRLVDKSILTMAPVGRRGRYRLLETMRLYGLERLREAGEESALQRRHAAWYAELISGGERPSWMTPAQVDVIELLDVEWANVEAALEYCGASPPNADMGLRMASDLWGYWTVRGSYRAGRRHVERLLSAAPEPSATRAMALWSIGYLAQAVGDHDIALAAFEEMQQVGAQTGGDRERAYALLGLGVVRLRLGEGKPAVELLVASRETMRHVDDPIGRAAGLYFLATALIAGGQSTDARALAAEGLEASEQAGDLVVRGVLNMLLGVIEWQLGDAQAAEERLREAVAIQSRLGHRWGMGLSLEGLAWVAASTERLERAAMLSGAVAFLWQELGIEPVPLWRVHRDACEATAREGLGEARYGVCWENGFGLGWEHVVALALEDAVPSPSPAGETTAEDAFELTARELEVARLVADGLSNPAIATALFVSRATVKTHVSHILQKLALDSRVQLASWVAANDPARTSL